MKTRRLARIPIPWALRWMDTRERLLPFSLLLAMAIVICNLWRSEVAVQTQGPGSKPVSVASQTNQNSTPAVPASPSFAHHP